MKEQLQKRPLTVAKDGVPRANDEIEDLLTPALKESEPSDK